ncbi:uncharacterized protein SCHCODRAFT_02087228 [Schizophyllum commune H4-8]|uniref:uncharacterized protein n=1 Tax=Schizophyllum commune (strain H4-8 / FGSC 9210) TaxID=578458 RepID=UPI00215E7699|nr:uncharacterized protein SCHCODRAFT_02087228 [Schizophyllum commune H4-8]KAI5887034.1 hypothetical protein SCHCODRAFT_02087228 [Schizophyllum commune H4-8]
MLSMVMRRKYLVHLDCAEARSGVHCPRCTTYQAERLQGHCVKGIMAVADSALACLSTLAGARCLAEVELPRFAVTQRRLLLTGASISAMRIDGITFLAPGSHSWCGLRSLLTTLPDVLLHFRRRIRDPGTGGRLSVRTIVLTTANLTQNRRYFGSKVEDRRLRITRTAFVSHDYDCSPIQLNKALHSTPHAHAPTRSSSLFLRGSAVFKKMFATASPSRIVPSFGQDRTLE